MGVDQARLAAGRREWLGLGVIVLACLLVSMDTSVLFHAVPALTLDLGPSPGQLLWIMDSYGFLLAGLLIAMGALGDRIGRRRLLLLGAVGFGAASVLTAFADSAELVIVGRVLLGVAGATIAPSTLALIRTMFPDPARRRSAIALWTAGFGAGAMIGPIVAGVLLERFWWGSVFLVNVPVMVLLLAAGPVLLPEFRGRAVGRFDVPGALLSLAAVLSVIYGGKRLAEGDAGVVSVAAVAAGCLLGVVFLRRQRDSANPLLDPTLFRDRRFSAALATTVVLQFALLGMILFSSLYFLVVLRISPFGAALWRLPAIGTLVLGLVLGGIMAKRLRARTIVVAGLLTAAAGFGLPATVTDDTGLVAVVVGGSVLTTGLGMVIVLATDLVLAAAPPERAGTASALSETATELGGALGIAVLGSISAAVYRVGVGDAIPAAVPADTARGSLAEAIRVADGLPEPARSALADAAVGAFADGMRVAVVVGCAALVAMAAAVALLTPDDRG
ncbi:MFS transporter [Actinokineospora sp.]|uniref:MFS transporter n=1 Tax=Actinokineospora sp. TaxID=1872133 RepID=UPI004037C793